MNSSDGRQEGNVGLACPACSPERPQVHEVLATGGDATVRCDNCGHVHKTQFGSESTVSVRTVVSVGEDSERTAVDVPTDEELAVGEEFVAELPDGPVGVRITSLEAQSGGREDSLHATEVATIWTRAVDNVGIPATIHPADGSREGTRSETYYLPGDADLVVGEGVPHLDSTVTIEGLVLEDDAVGYSRRKLDAHGDMAPAKDVARVYARETGGDNWTSAWG